MPLEVELEIISRKKQSVRVAQKRLRAHPGGANIDFDGGLREFIQGYEEKPAGKQPESFEIGRVR